MELQLFWFVEMTIMAILKQKYLMVRLTLKLWDAMVYDQKCEKMNK